MDGHLVCLAGNVGNDVQLRYSPQGVSIVEFSLAVEVNPHDRTSNLVSWWNVEGWGSIANKIAMSSFAKSQNEDDAEPGSIKGARVIVSGRHELRPWKTDLGETRIKPIIIADEIAFSIQYGPLDVVKLPMPEQDQKAQ